MAWNKVDPNFQKFATLCEMEMETEYNDLEEILLSY